MTEQMTLVDILGELTQRGIGFAGIFDKAVLLQRLEDAKTASRKEHQLEPEPEPEPELEPVPETVEPEPQLAKAEAGEEVLQLVVAGYCVRMQVRSVMGLSVWAAASAAAERGVEMLRGFRKQMPTAEPAPVALELGAGCALPSLVAALAGQQILATDGDADVVALMRRNFALNGLFASDGISADGRARSLAPRRLDWTNPSDLDDVLADWPCGFPLIVAAEVFWNCDSMDEFFVSVPKLLDRAQRCPPPSLLLAVSDDLFLDLTTRAVATAASHGMRLVARESVMGPTVSTSAYGTVLREEQATLLTFCHEHVAVNPMREAAGDSANSHALTPGKKDRIILPSDGRLEWISHRQGS
eukprot:COSAG02_NODE_22_length_53020_cov_16.223125_26_plen_357_part_00